VKAAVTAWRDRTTLASNLRAKTNDPLQASVAGRFVALRFYPRRGYADRPSNSTTGTDAGSMSSTVNGESVRMFRIELHATGFAGSMHDRVLVEGVGR
jgi:hypothetical protein